MAEENIFIDLDLTVAERDNQPVQVILKGEKLEFPGSAPGELVYRLLRLMDDEGNVKVNRVPDFWDALIGPVRMQELFGKGVTWDQLQVLQTELLSAWGITGGAAAEEAVDTTDPS